ncbi:hypothetical protein OCGS_1844 [Oceaniovalibus guishaninsula JLT2003]|uniref:UPF0102 protein OCGS_1844 n=1 Tax=Oceaniovalibus guishaninsula JLT2003 TaxID=1231392 RepID=K2H8D4_9RHOB|nr:YraN family protein [Oceaniovalibus guishaninsula]EKE43863.1 hypothetical protein OCGS_1844 [Oceaniovalibus guishaninsula JLT2003]
MSGARSYRAGLAAEERVAAEYRRTGHVALERRWRGAGGEIDLIFHKGAEVIFVEVKQSRSHDRAAASLSQRQIARLYAAAAEFLGTRPEGSLTPARFDVATVDGTGRVSILENAFA